MLGLLSRLIGRLPVGRKLLLICLLGMTAVVYTSAVLVQDAATGDVTGVEALVRWQHPLHGLVSPARFIPVAEDSGQIVAIGAWILDEASRQHAAWRSTEVGCVPVSINVSALQLRDPALPDLLTAALRTHSVRPEHIELELTETALMEDAVATVQTLERLRAIGVSLSIDDFGSGYSSLNYLRQFPIHKLKIDQSFVRDMLEDPADLAITRAIIGLGHTLGLTVTAEGVEQAEEQALLCDAGCDELQGYLFGRPMAPHALARWLAGRRLSTEPRPRPQAQSADSTFSLLVD